MVKAVTVGLPLAIFALAPAAAHAAKAELSRDGTELHVDSGVGEASTLRVTFDGAKFIVSDVNAHDVKPGRDCSNFASNSARCDGGFTKVVVDLGANDDSIDIEINKGATVDAGTGNDQVITNEKADKVDGGTGADLITTRGGDDEIDGGPGNDVASGGADNDEMIGGAGDDTLQGLGGVDKMSGGVFPNHPGYHTVGGTDTLEGGDGADRFFADPGHDVYRGGSGVSSIGTGDEIDYDLDLSSVTVTLDDAPNDGSAGENDNVHSDVEDVSLGGVRGGNVTGSPVVNFLFGGFGGDNIEGGAGADHMAGDSGDDVIIAREEPTTAAFADFVSCNRGTDTAIVDLLDDVSNDPSQNNVCETVEAAPVGQGPNVRIARKRIKVNRSGRVRLPLSCP